jgi:hypothetical protein
MYRDDGEAARVRADALQRELDANRRELAVSQRKLASARTRLAELGAADDEEDPRPERSPWRWIAVGTGGLVALGLMVGFAQRFDDEPGATRAAKPSPACTLRTDPPGATIVSRCTSPAHVARYNAAWAKAAAESGHAFADLTVYELTEGTTPLSRPHTQWIDGRDTAGCRGKLVAQLPGYREAPVERPVASATAGCAETVVRLAPE